MLFEHIQEYTTPMRLPDLPSMMERHERALSAPKRKVTVVFECGDRLREVEWTLFPGEGLAGQVWKAAHAKQLCHLFKPVAIRKEA